MAALADGNAAARAGDGAAARRHYAAALLEQPALAETVFGNLQRLLRAESAPGPTQAPNGPLRVIVAGCELGHNAAGRAAILTELHVRVGGRVELVGPVVSPYQDLWAPLHDCAWSRRTPSIPSFADFLAAMLPLVAAERADVLHLSKARGPNILTAALYKLFWNSTVVIDVDDEELGFVGAAEPLSLEAWRALPASARNLSTLFGREWTRLAVGLVGAFDGVTVANPALQARYGGVVIPHARDERALVPGADRRANQRGRWGIDPASRVVLFFGTPRAHKGLLEVAQALASLHDSRWQLVIVGDFEDAALQGELAAFPAGLIRSLPSQPISAIADVLSIADVCVLLQHGRGQAAQYQTPAKLTDALAMQVPVLVTETAGLREFIDADVVRATTPETLAADLTRWFDTASGAAEREALTARGRAFFEKQLSYAANVAPLASAVREASLAARAYRDALEWPPVQVLREVLRRGV
jgi:glycosyltransferase involved in cell wall biosynthesis